MKIKTKYGLVQGVKKDKCIIYANQELNKSIERAAAMRAKT